MSANQEQSPTLNPQQLEAVKHVDGPMLVVAGAGTGKTRVIVERIVRLIESGVKANEIVALTFTEKAAQEMIDRVNELRGGFSLDIQIATYNAFGEQLLRRFASDIGMHSNFRLLGDVGQVIFLKEHLQDLDLNYYSPVTNPEGLLGELANYFSQLKQRVIRPEDYEKYIMTLPAESDAEREEVIRHKELAKAFATYLQISKQENVIDYDDQIYLVLEILSSKPNVLAKLRKEVDYLLVDEFQDTNPMQAKLLQFLSATENNLMVVGDDDQSIYGFRGATISNILNFDKNYPGTQKVVLTKNYRSSQEILDSAYQLIKNNPDRLEEKIGLSKQLTAQFSGVLPRLSQYQSFNQEVSETVAEIKKLIEQGIDKSKIAVLTRKNLITVAVHEALGREGIDSEIAGQTHDLYREVYVRSFVDCLQVLEDRRNNTALYHVLTGPLFNIASDTISHLSSKARREHSYLEDLLTGEIEEITNAQKQLESWRQQLSRQSVGRLCYTILVESGLKDRLLSEPDELNATRDTIHISQFFDQLKEFEKTAVHTHAAAFLENLPLLNALSERSNDDLTSNLQTGAVSVLTIHKSKGLEWDHVFIVDVNEGSLPGRNRRSSLEIPSDLQNDEPPDFIAEERRLLYVAATRARQQLTLSCSFNHGGKLDKKPSRFLGEMFNDVMSKGDETPTSQVSLDLFASVDKSDSSLPKHLVRDGKLQLSVSQLGDYLRCPYDFYYRHMLAVPQEPSANLQIGSMLHTAIETYNRAKLYNDDLDESRLIEQLLVRPPREGFISAKERDRALKSATKSLQTFLERERNQTRIPNRIEEPFRIEFPDIRIIGRFDAVYDYDNDTEIRDYKSSDTVTDDKRAKSRAQSSDQLTIYALAWQQITGELPKIVSLDFFAKSLIGSVRKTQKGIDTMEGKIETSAKSILAGSFEPANQHNYCLHP